MKLSTGRCSLILLALLAAGCGGGGKTAGGETLSGAGSSLVYPLVSKWTEDYGQRAGVTVNYNPIGSGGGIAAITESQVDFGASDAPLTPAQARRAKGVLEIPWALAGTLFSYNLKGGPNRLRLTGPVLADIYLGHITSWNDPEIARLNPGVSLPSTKVTPVFRSDPSGDTYAITDYLSKVSPEWKRRVGVSTQVSFPKGTGGKGNTGVAGGISRTNGAIGYLAISYVFESRLSFALIRNAAGKFPVPRIESIAAAARTVKKLAPDNTVSLTNPPGSQPKAYPIATFTYALVPAKSPKAAALRKFLTYAIGDGQRFGRALQFAPLPDVVLRADRAAIARIK